MKDYETEVQWKTPDREVVIWMTRVAAWRPSAELEPAYTERFRSSLIAFISILRLPIATLLYMVDGSTIAIETVLGRKFTRGLDEAWLRYNGGRE